MHIQDERVSAAMELLSTSILAASTYTRYKQNSVTTYSIYFLDVDLYMHSSQMHDHPYTVQLLRQV